MKLWCCVGGQVKHLVDCQLEVEINCCSEFLEADVSSVGPSSEQVLSNEGLTLETSASRNSLFATAVNLPL